MLSGWTGFSRTTGRLRRRTIPRQSSSKPGEPELVALTLVRASADRSNAVRPLSATEKKLLDDLEKMVKTRAKLNDYPDMVEHRK